jgi:hypothetical protein
LPDALTVGTEYELVLRVQDADDPNVGDEATTTVEIKA